MDSRKNKILCKIFAIIMLNLYLRLATATNIDCHGKSFHCVNSTHFMICVDLGGGVSITVNDFVIQCPPTTVCGEDNNLECTYLMPTTTQTNIHLGDETNDFTTDTRIITTTSSDITKKISSIDQTSPTGLFNEYFNTIKVTTFAQDVQTYTTEVSEIPEILNKNNVLTNVVSNVLTATTDLYSVENPFTKFPEMHSPNEQIISEQSFVATIKDIERKTLFSDGPDLNVDSSSMKSMDVLHDAPTETVAKNPSTVIDREVNTLKDGVNHFTQNNNRDIGTKSQSEVIASTETTLLTHYPSVPKYHNFQNTSTRAEITTNQGDQKIHQVDNIFTSVNQTQINDLMTKEENVTENSLFVSTDNYNFNNTRIESEIELTNEGDLMGPKTQNIKLINTLSPFKLNESEITIAYNFTNFPSTLETKITTSGYVAEKVLVSTESAISFNDNETLMIPKRGTNPTSQSPIILENQVPDHLESKSTVNKIKMTSLDNKLISEDSTITQAASHELGKEIQKIKMETIFASHLNDNTPPPGDDVLEGTSTIKTDNLYFDHHPSTINYRSTITGLNLLEQKIQNDKLKKSTSYEQHNPEVTVRDDISTTYTNIPNLPVNTIVNATNDFSTSLVTTFNSIEHMSEGNEAMETTTAYSNEILQEASPILTEESSSTDSPTSFNYNASNTENITEMEMNKTSARDIYNYSSYEIIITTPRLNINDKRLEIMATETFHNTTEYNKLLPQEENIPQVAVNLYSNDTSLSIENSVTKSELNLEEQQLRDNDTYMSTQHEQYKSELTVSENIPTTHPKTHDYSVYIESSLFTYDFKTTSLLPTFEQATEIERVTDRSKVIEGSTIPYNNTVLHSNLSENENATEKSPQVAHNSTQSEYHVSDIKKMAKNKTTPTPHYKKSTYKPADQNIMQKVLYDTQTENMKLLSKVGAVKDSIYYASNTANITEMNTTSAHDNHNSSYKVMITLPQSDIKSQRVEVMFTETSHNTTEYNKVLSQEENILHVSENPYSNDTSLSIENSVSKSELYLEEQQIGDSNTYTSTQHEQYKSELSVSENIPTKNPITYDFSVYTESTLLNYDVTTLLSTFKKETEIEQVTDSKKAIERTIIPYTNLLENENATEKSLQVALNSTQSEYRISDIRNMVKSESTPARYYENTTYYPGIQNIIQKILYDTQIEKTKPLNNLGALKDSIVTTPSMDNVISNIKVGESTTMKPELTPMAVFNSVSDLALIQNDQMKDVHPLSKSVLISSATPLSQDGQNTLNSWRDVISTSNENSIISKNNRMDLNRVTVDSAHGNLNFIEITANMTDNKNNSNVALDTLQYKKPIEMVLLTGFDKFKRENKSSDTIKELYNAGQITTGPEIDSNTHTTDVTIQNQEAFYDTMKLTSQDHNIQTTEKSLRQEYNLIQTDILVTYDKVTSSTLKPLITTVVTGVDEILSTPNQITTGVVTESYLSTANSKDMVINTTNKVSQNNFIHVQDSYAQVYVTQAEDAAQKLTDKLINNETEQYFITTTIRSNNDTNTNTTNKSLFQSPYGHYFASNMSLPYLEKIKHNEEVDSSLERNLNFNERPPGIVENVHNTYSVTQKAKSVNITDNFINGQSNVLSVNFPNQHYYNNDSIQRNYTINDSEIVTSIPISDRYNDSSHTALYYNHTINNGDLKNEELFSTKEDRISNKSSMFVTTKIPTDVTTFIIDKSYADHKDRITTDKPPLSSQVFIDLPSSTTTGELRGIDIIGDFYEESDKANDTRKEQSSTGVAANSTEHGNLLKMPNHYLQYATTVPYRPLVVLKNIKQASLVPKLKQMEQKDDLHLNSTHGSNYEEAGIGQTKRVQPLSITPKVAVNVNKRFITTTNLVKIKLLNNTNVGMKPNKRSTNTTLFSCNYRLRGRFADKNNCRKYYICIGINKPILGECPKNTVFSEIKKQCTKNLSHCIRNNQFRCSQEGRFSDVLRTNIYYICVHYNNAYVRFQFQCQNGFHLNKTSVKCVKDIKFQSQSQITSVSADSLSNKGSDQSTVESQLKEKKQSKEDPKYICKKEGKFPDGEDCRRYYVCSKNSKSVFRRRTKKCDSDEVFHREKKKCVDIDSYECA